MELIPTMVCLRDQYRDHCLLPIIRCYLYKTRWLSLICGCDYKKIDVADADSNNKIYLGLTANAKSSEHHSVLWLNRPSIKWKIS